MEHNVTMLDQKYNPVISPSYAMLSLSEAYIDEELYHTVNTALHCQFKIRSIGGTPVSSMFCAGSRSSQRTPVKAPNSSQLSSKHFPSQRSNHLPSDRLLGAKIQAGSKQGARGGREGMEGEKKRV